MPFKRPLRPLFRAAVLVIAAAAPSSVQAGDDFGLWTDVSAERKISKRFSVEAGLDFRAEQQLRDASRWSLSAGGSYKATDFLKLATGYAFIRDHSPMEGKVNYTQKGKVNGYNVDHSFWRSKHRAYFDVTGKLRLGRFGLGLRERYQYTHYMATTIGRDRYRNAMQPGYTGAVYEWNGEQFMELTHGTDDKRAKDAHYLRSRLQIEYNIRRCPVDPFASYELSNNLSDAMHLDKTRLTVGAEWKIQKKHVISLAYIYQNGHDDDDDDDIHVIDLGYKFKF